MTMDENFRFKVADLAFLRHKMIMQKLLWGDSTLDIIFVHRTITR